ncbi:zona pellucida-binding protein 1-like [Callorhinchus milii]|uniref:zona pellucida-binding protein 1-like n=1 Tax=Callorhinchus milii TaxID=7868 RepID=UPI001C3FEA55|nr:zona pellucida-binding protein 1-like [Callorhinchus milii]
MPTMDLHRQLSLTVDSPCPSGVLCDLLDNSNLTMKDQTSVNKLSQELISFASSLLKSPGTTAPSTGKAQVTQRLIFKTVEETQSTRQVFGRLGETVQVLIPWRGRPITMFCLTPELQQRGIINPSIQWVKEGDSPVSIEGEGTQFKVQQDGSLIVLNWENQQFSGFYSCTMTFGQQEAQHKLMLRFCLVVYHIPLKSLQVAARLKTTTCENGSVKNSAAVKSSLDFMCRQLSCEVSDVTSECRENTAVSQRGLYQLQLNITDTQTQEDCTPTSPLRLDMDT